jgi:hypothetical protein
MDKENLAGAKPLGEGGSLSCTYVYQKVLILSDRLKEVLLFFLTFLLPFGILSLAYLKAGIHPLGSKTILICDMSGQYVDFFQPITRFLKKAKASCIPGRPDWGLISWVSSLTIFPVLFLF